MELLSALTPSIKRKCVSIIAMSRNRETRRKRVGAQLITEDRPTTTEVGQDRPTSTVDVGLGPRLSEAVERLGGRAAAAAAADTSVDSIKRWLDNPDSAKFKGVANLCAKAGLPLEYVAFGNMLSTKQNEDEKEIRDTAMEIALHIYEVEAKLYGLNLTSLERRAELMSVCYAHARSRIQLRLAPDDQDARDRHSQCDADLKSVLERLKKPS